MTKIEMLQQALDELGEVSADELARFFCERYGVKLNPRMVPILRASLVEKEMLDRVRREAEAAMGPTEPTG